MVRDYAESARWYRKAADQGFAPSQTVLGTMYALGLGVEKNISKARYWLQTACGNGDQNGCEFLNKL